MIFDFSNLKIDVNEYGELIIEGIFNLNEYETSNPAAAKFLIKAYAIKKAIIYNKLNCDAEFRNAYNHFYSDFFNGRTRKWSKFEQDLFMDMVNITIPDSNAKITFK